MKPSFKTQMDRTQTDVGQITCWCITVALHQDFGIGRERLDAVSKRMNELGSQCMAERLSSGMARSDASREAWLDGYCDPNFRVPMLRAPRGRKEQQLKIAGDTAASIAWQIYAKACIDVLHFGKQRLERLKELSWKNYEQFNQWAHDDGLDVALEMLKRCAESALREKLRVVDDYEASDAQTKDVERELRQAAESRARLNATIAAARTRRMSDAILPGSIPEDEMRKVICEQLFAENLMDLTSKKHNPFYG